jgi:hypothetical protein
MVSNCGQIMAILATLDPRAKLEFGDILFAPKRRQVRKIQRKDVYKAEMSILQAK